MKKILLFLLSICYIVLLNVCVGCKYSCEGYDINDKTRISYRLNDSVVYVSDNNDTLVFVVDDFYAEGPHSWRGLVMDYWCNPECYYKMTSLSDSQMTIMEKETWDVEVCFCEDKPYRDVYSLVNKDYEFEDINKLQIDTITYYCVDKVHDLSGQRRIDSFMKAIEHGIIQFHDKQTDLTWTLVYPVGE